ncbi:MAG: hypothetical protein ACETVZ_00960, partial [Phycisphaerae bacterium]
PCFSGFHWSKTRTQHFSFSQLLFSEVTLPGISAGGLAPIIWMGIYDEGNCNLTKFASKMRQSPVVSYC